LSWDRGGEEQELQFGSIFEQELIKKRPKNTKLMRKKEKKGFKGE
jgi:hypothetical protein